MDTETKTTLKTVRFLEATLEDCQIDPDRWLVDFDRVDLQFTGGLLVQLTADADTDAFDTDTATLTIGHPDPGAVFGRDWRTLVKRMILQAMVCAIETYGPLPVEALHRATDSDGSPVVGGLMGWNHDQSDRRLTKKDELFTLEGGDAILTEDGRQTIRMRTTDRKEARRAGT